MDVLLISGDLMLVSSGDGLVSGVGGRLTTAPPGEAVAKATELQPQLAVLDLRAPGLDPGVLVPALRQASAAPIFILACGPHVHEADLAAAAQAGCDEVATRGQFEIRLRAAIERLA